jgi:hypothetical protein
MSKLFSTSNPNRVIFICPGCDGYHEIDTTRWGFNGSFEAPTFTPSILVTTGHYCQGRADNDHCWCTYYKEYPDKEVHFKCGVCHSYVTDGKIQFLGDCTHPLAGQTVELPDIKEV